MIKINPDKELVAEIRDALKLNEKLLILNVCVRNLESKKKVCATAAYILKLQTNNLTLSLKCVILFIEINKR